MRERCHDRNRGLFFVRIKSEDWRCYTYIAFSSFRKPRSSKDCGKAVGKTRANGMSDKSSLEGMTRAFLTVFC
jgi:hypothetical protein